MSKKMVQLPLLMNFLSKAILYFHKSASIEIKS